jgi:outer membrane protein OmpA-like peptidoglycan-associated protein
MRHLSKSQLAIALTLAAGLTAGCSSNPERASTNEREEAEVVSTVTTDAPISEADGNYNPQAEDYSNLQNRNQVSSISEENTVLFEFDSADLTDSAKDSLDEIAEALQGQGNAVESIKIHGYTDAMGPNAYNEQLSENRAKSVRNYLRDQGVNASSWEVEGKGEADPVASNEDLQGRRENRRVVIELSGDNVRGLSSNYSGD